MLKYSIAIWMIILSISCKQKITTIQNGNSNSTNSSIVQSSDSSEKKNAHQKLPKEHPDYVQTLQENKLENDIYYQTRKGRFKQGDSIKIGNFWLYFKENLSIGTLDNRNKHDYKIGEFAPGILSYSNLYQIRYNRPDSNTFWYSKLIYLDSNYNIFKEFHFDKHNPISLKGKKVTCISCFDGENCTSELKSTSGRNIYKMANHFWTRPNDFSAINTGYYAIRYAISARDERDCLIDDINTIIVLDPKGNIIHQLENLVANISQIIISPCGNFLWVGSGGIHNSNMESIRHFSMDLYDLKTGKVVLHFDHGFNLPIYEFQTGLHILSHDVNENNIPEYLTTKLYFDYKNRNYKEIHFTKSQFTEIHKNYFKSIRNHSKLLELYPYETINF